MAIYFDNLQRNYTDVSIMEDEYIEFNSNKLFRLTWLMSFKVIYGNIEIHIPEKLVNEQGKKKSPATDHKFHIM
ncbi:7621_t:CDS:2 [Rhizophagus irregularis]|nr:7621_t:CDS:2 [Rhizophagus irregularis]